MYFPWCGLIDQVRLADVFVHYDDVQYTRGFYSRVQVKTEQGIRWLTVPLRDQHRGQLIDEVLIDDRTDWRQRHRNILRQAHRQSLYLSDMLEVVDRVFATKCESLGALGRESIRQVAAYFDLPHMPEFYHSQDLQIGGASSQRLRDITRVLGGTVYLTGHGALNYLDYDLFEEQEIEVRYMNYGIAPYPQAFGTFTPYVTSLDAIANCGPQVRDVLRSTTLNWRETLEQRSRRISA